VVNELRITHDDQDLRFEPGQEVRIGRSPDNDIVVKDPRVSRLHARLTWGPEGWLLESLGRAGTFRNGRPVTRLAVRGPVELTLATPGGPALRLDAPALDTQATLGADSTAPSPGTVAAAEAKEPAGADPARTAAARPGGAGRAAGGASPRTPQDLLTGARQAGPGDELVTAFQILVPVKAWLHNPGWRQGLRLLVIPYALLPLIYLALFASSGNLSTPGWAYSLYVAPLWGIAFWLLIRPGPVGRQEALIGAGIVVWTLLWMKLVTAPIDSKLNPRSFIDALGVGFNEEITKALPVLLAGLLLLKLRSVKLDPRMWMFLGTIAGLTFGVREQAIYTVKAISTTTLLGLLQGLRRITAAEANILAVREMLQFSERVFVDGLQHAIWAGVAGFFMGMAVNYRRRRVQLIALGITIPALLHCVNDWYLSNFSSLWPWILEQGFSVLLFLGYTMSAASIERTVRRTPMFRGESILMDKFSEPGAGGSR
jgi:RsiW-degrading membrane proteinase PrsW (M82 family)